MSKLKIFLFFILYLSFSISINIVHPITTTYVNNLNLPDYFFGFFFSLMSLGQVIGAIIFGYLSDKIGRKWLISIGLVLYGFTQFGFGFINSNPYVILIFRILSGIVISAPHTLFVSMCLDISYNKNQVKYLSILSSILILGTSLGYEIGGALYNYLSFSISQIFLFQIFLSIITGLIFLITMQDINLNKLVKNNKFSFNSLFSLPKMTYLFLIGFLILSVGQILINKYLDPFIIHNGFEPVILGHYVLITGIISSISNLIIIPFFKKLKNKKLAICLVSLILFSSLITYFTFLSDFNLIILLFSSHLLYLIFKGLITPLEQNEIASFSSGENYGKLMGARQTILSIGNVVGPLIGSIFYVKGSSSVFVIASSLILISLLIFIYYFTLKFKLIKKDK